MRSSDAAFGTVMAAIAFAILLLALLVWVAQLLWNGVVTDITDFSDISYWQMAGLFILGRLVTGTPVSKST